MLVEVEEETSQEVVVEEDKVHNLLSAISVISLDTIKEEEILLMTYFEENREVKEEMWYIDSGCSNHMVGTKEWFLILMTSSENL